MFKVKTSQEIEKEFREELRALLRKYNANITASDHYNGYPECGEDIRMIVEIPGTHDDYYEPIKERTEIDLGRYVDGE